MLFGGSSGKPMRYISPPAACATRSDDFQTARGPVAPNPDMRAWMMRGLMLRSASASRSADAAELSSTSTSAEATRRSNVFAALRAPPVERYAAPAPVEVEEVQALRGIAAHERRETALVRAARRLDVEHVRAEVGEEFRAVRAGFARQGR